MKDEGHEALGRKASPAQGAVHTVMHCGVYINNSFSTAMYTLLYSLSILLYSSNLRLFVNFKMSSLYTDFSRPVPIQLPLATCSCFKFEKMVATFRVPSSLRWLVVTVLDSTDAENFHHRKFY